MFSSNNKLMREMDPTRLFSEQCRASVAQAGQFMQDSKDHVELLSLACVAFAFMSTLLYFSNKTLSITRARKDGQPSFIKTNLGSSKEINPRCIVQRMDETEKNCVVFYGSQTGNAQDFAEKLAKEGHTRFGLQTMAADLDDYDFSTLANFSEDKVAIFVLASYGEGEPTDNAVGFYEFITEHVPVFSYVRDEEAPLQAMRYAAFGLGNSTYEHYNSVIREVDTSLERLGAKRIAMVGEGDDGKGTMEDSFLSWKDTMWNCLRQSMDLKENETCFEPNYLVTEQHATKASVYLGERSQDELLGKQHGPHGAHNPAILNVLKAGELFNTDERNCLHMELDLRGSGMFYQTGDHAAIWPMNADAEVDRFLRVFGLLQKRHTPIHVTPVDSTGHVPVPSPTTYDAAVRYYLEIAGPVSRQSLAFVAEFAKDPDQKTTLSKLSKEKDHFHDVVGNKLLNLAQLIETISPENPCCTIPFAVLLESVRVLQPRYYSISSSSLTQKETISITVAVESTQFPNRYFKGLASNYLLALKNQREEQTPRAHGCTYALSGPREKYRPRLPVHIRHSTFKLPTNTSRPIIMVGPGTGVAPFRAFVHERAAQFQAGISVGKSILFYGCRKGTEDFIYRDEWQSLQKTLGDRFELYTALSRETEKKVYVQHLLSERAAEIVPELLDRNGHLYICGDARMAREVQNVLCGLISQVRHIILSDAEVIVREMKSKGQFQEDTW